MLVLFAAAQLGDALTRWARESLHGGIERALRLVLDPAVTGEERRLAFILDAEGHPTPAELDAFAAAFLDRYGELKEVIVTSTALDGDGGDDGMDLAASAMLRAGEGNLLAAIRFRLVPSAAGTEAALVGATIFDRSRGALSIGVIGDGDAPPAGGDGGTGDGEPTGADAEAAL